MHRCRTKKHSWSSRLDADKCCNGYIRVMVFNPDDADRWNERDGYGFAWHKVEGSDAIQH